MRALPGWTGVESDAVAFVAMGEDRLLLALEAPEGTLAQPLTLAAMQVGRRLHSGFRQLSDVYCKIWRVRSKDITLAEEDFDDRPLAKCSIGCEDIVGSDQKLEPVQEMQRSLFLLTGMARLLGQWQLALPGSLPAARLTAASFLALTAQALPGERFQFHCPAVSPSEKVRNSHISFTCRLLRPFPYLW